MKTVVSPFSSWLIVSSFFSLLIANGQFFTRIALGDVDLCFWLILITKASAVEEGTMSVV
jgi:hypothetical protein